MTLLLRAWNYYSTLEQKRAGSMISNGNDLQVVRAKFSTLA
jgi:hypothetical protein